MSDIGMRAPTESIRTQLATNVAATEMGNREIGRSQVTGEAVVGGVDQSDITDALEELGSAVAHRRKPTLEESKVRKGQGTSMDALGRIAQYQEKLPDQPMDQRLRDLKERIDEFQRQMERGAGRPTKDDILEALARYDGDVSHQFAALEQMRQGAVEAGAGEQFIALLDSVRADFRERTLARDVSAGFAAGRVAHRDAEKLGAAPGDIRDAYRAVVRDNQNMGQVFDHLRGFNVARNFGEIVDTFQKIAGAELASISQGSTTVFGEQRQILGNLVGELGKLKQMASVYDEARGALVTLERMHPDLARTAGKPDATELASRLLHFGANPAASIRDAERIVAGIATDDPGVAVSAINTVRDVHMRMPDAVMPSPTARESQGRALMDLSSRLVAQEEAAFAAGGR